MDHWISRILSFVRKKLAGRCRIECPICFSLSVAASPNTLKYLGGNHRQAKAYRTYDKLKHIGHTHFSCYSAKKHKDTFRQKEHIPHVGNLDYQEFSSRRRPHFNPPDGTFFLTFRLADSIPKSVVREYKERYQWFQDHLRRVQRLTESEASEELMNWRTKVEDLNREWFRKTEEILHRADHGPRWMSNAAVADKVAENLHRLDGAAYRLDAYSIMSNHAHTVFKPFLSQIDFSTVLVEDGLLLINEHPGLSKIMHSLKGRSARECNLLLGRTGSFWEHESFDHAIREGKFDKTVRYVLDNPLKVGLVQNWEDWRWNYCRNELVERFRKK